MPPETYTPVLYRKPTHLIIEYLEDDSTVIYDYYDQNTALQAYGDLIREGKKVMIEELTYEVLADHS